jgi:DNA-binding MarR family transcriptional regulator
MHSSSRTANLLGALGIVLADALAEAGGDSEAAALVAIGGPSAGASIEALSAVVRLSHSGTVRLVDRLEADGLLERRRGADQRSAALLLTPAGRRAARHTLRSRDANLQFIVSLLTEDQQDALIDVAERVLGELGARPDAERRICRLCDVDACGRSRGECPVMPARRRRHAA